MPVHEMKKRKTEKSVEEEKLFKRKGTGRADIYYVGLISNYCRIVSNKPGRCSRGSYINKGSFPFAASVGAREGLPSPGHDTATSFVGLL